MTQHLILFRYIHIKTDRMMLSTFVVFLPLVVVAECSKLPENHDIVKELKDTIYRLEMKFAETEARRDEELKMMKQECNKEITGRSEAVDRMEVNFVKRYEELKKSTNQLEVGLSKIKVKTADCLLRTETLEQQGKANQLLHFTNMHIIG